MARGVGSQVFKQERMSDALACLDMNRATSFFMIFLLNDSLTCLWRIIILSVFSRALEG